MGGTWGVHEEAHSKLSLSVSVKDLAWLPGGLHVLILAGVY